MPTPTAVPTAAVVPTRSTWLKRALIVSLALNLLIVGLLAGAVLAHRRGHKGGEHYRSGLTGYLATLPAARREAILTATRGTWSEIKAARKEARRLRSALDQALVAEPFDKARLTAAHVAVVEAEQRVRGPLQALFTEIAGALTPEERRQYIVWREKVQAGRKGGAPGE